MNILSWCVLAVTKQWLFMSLLENTRQTPSLSVRYGTVIKVTWYAVKYLPYCAALFQNFHLGEETYEGQSVIVVVII